MDKVENSNNKILFKKLVKIAIDNWKYVDYGYLCRKLIYALARTQLMFHYEDPEFSHIFTDDEIKKIDELIEIEHDSLVQDRNIQFQDLINQYKKTRGGA